MRRRGRGKEGQRTRDTTREESEHEEEKPEKEHEGQKDVKTKVTKETAQKLMMKNGEQERLKEDEDEEAA